MQELIECDSMKFNVNIVVVVVIIVITKIVVLIYGFMSKKRELN